MPTVQDEHRLCRAWDYANPRTPTDLLPIAYGDLATGGNYGVWVCPCIDTVNYVYAISGCEVLSAANGNSFTVYDKDNTVIDGANYTINAANNYETKGIIATITFTTDRQTDEPISARCKGRHFGNVLIENPISQIEDFCENIAGMTTPFNTTWLERARSYAAAQGYKSALAIVGDRTIGFTITEMISSFWGDWWLDKNEKILLRLDRGPLSINESDICDYIHPKWFDEATKKAHLRNVCNQIEAKYRYNWRSDGFEGGNDGEATKDAASQSRYGIRKKTFEYKSIRDASTLAIMQALMVQALKDPPKEYEFRVLDLRHARLEKGDYVAISSRWLKDNDGNTLRNQIAKISALEIDGSVSEMRMTVVDMQRFKTKSEPLNGTWTLGGSVQLGGARDTNLYC